jgi:hypothetical protein
MKTPADDLRHEMVGQRNQVLVGRLVLDDRHRLLRSLRLHRTSAAKVRASTGGALTANQILLRGDRERLGLHLMLAGLGSDYCD